MVIKKYDISVPGKTFLLGEYVALNGGPTLILTTKPRFHLIVHEKPLSFGVEGISLESPAGKLILSDPSFYQNYHFKFIDPYYQKGGFGASSAQFIAVYALKEFVKQKELNPSNLLNDYRLFSKLPGGLPPSGADVIAQTRGQICYFNKSENKLESYTWPFADLVFGLIHTGNKLATHHHLQTLDEELDTHALSKIARLGLQALEKSDSDTFVSAINAYSTLMQTKGLLADSTKDLLALLSANPHILAKKGCGSLGADVILILFKKTHQDSVLAWLQNKKLDLMVYGQEVSAGVNIQAESEKVNSMANNKSTAPEKIILVDPEDRYIGEIEKLLAHEYAMLHRAFSVFLFRIKNNKIEVLLHQRSKQKYHTGGLWTNTCCSHPHLGENLIESAKTRLHDEMGISADLKYAGKFHYVAPVGNGLTENEMDHVLIGTYNKEGDIPINKQEIEDYQWVNVDTLKKDLSMYPERFTPWLKEALDLALASFKEDSAVKDIS